MKKNLFKNLFLLYPITCLFPILASAQYYDKSEKKEITYVCSYCGQQSSVPIQGAACGFSDGQNHNWIPVR
jgi:hypothetical protein